LINECRRIVVNFCCFEKLKKEEEEGVKSRALAEQLKERMVGLEELCKKLGGKLDEGRFSSFFWGIIIQDVLEVLRNPFLLKLQQLQDWVFRSTHKHVTSESNK
jgi:hypothetical protein